MHCHCGTNNRAPRWTFTDSCKPEVRPGAREESASPAWLAAPAMNARNTTKVYIWRLDTGCGQALYRKCHSQSQVSRTIYLPRLMLLGQCILELSVAEGVGDWYDLLTLTFDLLTWISIGIIYSSRTLYLPSLKLLGQSVVELSVAQGLGILTYRHDTEMCKAICPSFFEGGTIIK